MCVEICPLRLLGQLRCANFQSEVGGPLDIDEIARVSRDSQQGKARKCNYDRSSGAIPLVCGRVVHGRSLVRPMRTNRVCRCYATSQEPKMLCCNMSIGVRSVERQPRSTFADGHRVP